MGSDAVARARAATAPGLTRGSANPAAAAHSAMPPDAKGLMLDARRQIISHQSPGQHAVIFKNAEFW